MSQAVQIIEGKAINARPIRREPAGPITVMDILDGLTESVSQATSGAKMKAVGLLQTAQYELDVQKHESWAIVLGIASTSLSGAAEKLESIGSPLNLIKEELKPLAQIQRGARDATKLATLGEAFLPNVSRAVRSKFEYEIKGQMAEIRQQADRTIDALMEQKLIGMNTDGTIRCSSDAIKSLADRSITILKADDDELLAKLIEMKGVKAKALSELQRVKTGQEASGFSPLITDTVVKSGELQGLRAAALRITHTDVPNQETILSEIQAKASRFSKPEKVLASINL